MSDLATTQHWMQGLITGPEGFQSHAAGTGVDPASRRRSVEAVVNGAGGLSAIERVALYARTYRERLTGCLRESYPGLRHALGDELFDDFAEAYLREQPSRSYTLATLGAGWPAHLEATRPDHDRPLDQRASWPDFLIDLARLERAFCEAYDALGVEGCALPGARDLASAVGTDERRPELTVTPVRCLRLLAARFPVGSYLVAVRRGERPPPPAPRQSFVALSRRDYVVTITQLTASGHLLLGALRAGASLATASRGAGLEQAEAWRLVGDWADRGLVARLDLPRPERPGVRSTEGMPRC